EAALTPAMQERGERYLFAEGSRIPVPGGRNVAGAAAPVAGDGVDLLGMARTVYDVAHAERPWGWKVSTYLWTKSVAAGALLVAAASAGYSAFLFGQAEGRAFWQSALVLPHLLVAAVTAGCASLLLAALAVSGDPSVAESLGVALWFSLAASAVVLFTEIFTAHSTQDAARAARLIARGPFCARFWWGVVLGGTAVPLVLLLNPSLP